MHATRRQFLSQSTAAIAATAAGAVFAQAPKTSPAPAVRPTAADADELANLDGLALADLVRRKQVTPRELVDAAIARVERLNPAINAVVTETYEQARTRTDGPVPQGPFAGVPYLLKDLDPNKGVRLTYGSVLFKDNIADETSEIIRRMEQAGLIVIGKTNTPEFGLLPTTEPRLFGPCRNPWNRDYSSGGSSGGAAAAVAARIVPLAQASDGGGSIRIPASCCGLFGLKISRGRNPEAPGVEDDGLSVVHCVSLSVRDSAALLDATRGPTAGERWYAAPPKRPYAQEVGAPPGKLKIAMMTKDLAGNAAHADCVAAVTSTAKLCEELGHTVEEASPKIDGEAYANAFMVLWAAVAGRVVKAATKVLGSKPPEEALEPWTWKLAEKDATHTPADASLAWSEVLQPASYEMVRFLSRYDLLLTPVLGLPPIKIGELQQTLSYDAMLERLLTYVAYTPFVNATGQPAMSVPLYWNAAGLPIGSHFVARHGDEATLVRLASQLERARPWIKRRPTQPGK
ncbi:MAG: amidase [Planctomycetia bacterium]|nr:amidase [Planctomycetia bacterium]